MILDLLNSGRLTVDDQIIAAAPLEEGTGWFSKLFNREIDPGKVILTP